MAPQRLGRFTGKPKGQDIRLFSPSNSLSVEKERFSFLTNTHLCDAHTRETHTPGHQKFGRRVGRRLVLPDLHSDGFALQPGRVPALWVWQPCVCAPGALAPPPAEPDASKLWPFLGLSSRNRLPAHWPSCYKCIKCSGLCFSQSLCRLPTAVFNMFFWNLLITIKHFPFF